MFRGSAWLGFLNKTSFWLQIYQNLIKSGLVITIITTFQVVQSEWLTLNQESFLKHQEWSITAWEVDWLLLVSWDKRRDSPSQLIHVFHHLVEYRLSVGQLATERYELFGDSPRDSILRCVITQVCSCPPGYEGDPYTGCTQDPCNPSPCGENGICERNGKIFLLQHDFFISLHLDLLGLF